MTDLERIEARLVAVMAELSAADALNRQQAENLTAAWHKISRLQNRVDTLQPMVDWQRDRIEQLEREASPLGQAERVFSGKA